MNNRNDLNKIIKEIEKIVKELPIHNDLSFSLIYKTLKSILKMMHKICTILLDMCKENDLDNARIGHDLRDISLTHNQINITLEDLEKRVKKLENGGEEEEEEEGGDESSSSSSNKPISILNLIKNNKEEFTNYLMRESMPDYITYTETGLINQPILELAFTFFTTEKGMDQNMIDTSVVKFA